jgi:hypothetical protein
MKAPFLLLLLLLPQALGADDSGADFLLAQVPARPAGMGGVFVAFHDDPSAFLWNPASVAYALSPAISATEYNSIVDTSYEELSYAQDLDLLQTPGGLGLGVQYDSTANLEQTDLQGNDIGAINNYDLVLQGAYGIRLNRELSLGLGLKGFGSQLAEYHSSGYAVDLGAQSDLNSWLGVGLAFQNLGEESAYDSGTDPLPAAMRLGLRIVAVNEENVLVQAGAEIVKEWDTSYPTLVNFGAEYYLARVVALRAGWSFGEEEGNLSLGAGLTWEGISFDYAYVSLGDLGLTQRFSLTTELGKFIRHETQARSSP